MNLKGYRTCIYHGATAVAALTAIALTTDWTTLGVNPRGVILIGLAAKVVDSLVAIYLRTVTTTPTGCKE